MALVSGDGARIAQLFRQQRNLDIVRACDLAALAREDELEICDFGCDDPGCTAALLRVPGGAGGGILLAPGQNPGRRRFSIAHEFGHYHMPAHADLPEFDCTDSDMRSRSSDAKRMEWEANDFAAELLMPRKLFAQDAARGDISFETVYRLAGQDMYAVSATAAAWRLVQLSRDRCALVMSVDGRIAWVARSSSFGLPLIEKNQSLNAESLAAAARRREGTTERAVKIPWHAWFDGQAARGELLESTHEIVSLGHVLSLLWFIEREPEEDED